MQPVAAIGAGDDVGTAILGVGSLLGEGLVRPRVAEGERRAGPRRLSTPLVTRRDRGVHRRHAIARADGFGLMARPRTRCARGGGGNAAAPGSRTGVGYVPRSFIAQAVKALPDFETSRSWRRITALQASIAERHRAPPRRGGQRRPARRLSTFVTGRDGKSAPGSARIGVPPCAAATASAITTCRPSR